MNSAAELRKQIESALADRIPSALTARPIAVPELVSCGVAKVDAALGGGLPLGGITELTGPASSGRTTLALATLAEVTRQEGACAYVDVSDCLDPLSAAALGVDLRRLFWVRAGNSHSNPEQAGHPAFSSGCPTLSPAIGEGWVIRPKNRTNPWSRLEQALRATDLLLNTGGFRAIVLDMGDVRPEHARRVPLATWYRFRLEVEKSQALFLLLTRVACANSCAAISLRCAEARAHWQRATVDSSPLLAGLRYSVEIARNRAVDVHREKTAASAPGSPASAGVGARTAWNSTTSWTSAIAS